MTQKKRPPAKAAKAEDVKERTVPIKIYFSPGLAARLTEAVALRKREGPGGEPVRPRRRSARGSSCRACARGESHARRHPCRSSPRCDRRGGYRPGYCRAFRRGSRLGMEFHGQDLLRRRRSPPVPEERSQGYLAEIAICCGFADPGCGRQGDRDRRAEGGADPPPRDRIRRHGGSETEISVLGREAHSWGALLSRCAGRRGGGSRLRARRPRQRSR